MSIKLQVAIMILLTLTLAVVDGIVSNYTHSVRWSEIGPWFTTAILRDLGLIILGMTIMRLRLTK